MRYFELSPSQIESCRMTYSITDEDLREILKDCKERLATPPPRGVTNLAGIVENEPIYDWQRRIKIRERHILGFMGFVQFAMKERGISA